MCGFGDVAGDEAVSWLVLSAGLGELPVMVKLGLPQPASTNAIIRKAAELRGLLMPLRRANRLMTERSDSTRTAHIKLSDALIESAGAPQVHGIEL